MKEALRVRPMKEEYMEEVSQRHIETFNEGRKIFEDECLAKQMEFADGHIGNFLRQCSKISDWGGLEGRTDDSRLLSVTDLRDFIRDEIRDVARNPDLRSYLDEIRTAALNRRQEVALDPGVLGTQLMYTLLMESLDGGTPKMYAIRPLVADVLYEIGKDAKNDTV
jgi:hypothetical protein